MKIWLGIKAVGILAWLAGQPLVGALLFFGPDPWFFWQFASPASCGFGPVYARFRARGKELWLTIDDGPDPESTLRALDLLDHYGAKATFFVIGENVTRHPELLREVVRRGHRVANHSHTHPASRFWVSGLAACSAEINRCQAAVQDAIGTTPDFFRPPAGVKTVVLHHVLARAGLRCVVWNVRGYDGIDSSTTAADRILRQLQPGSIVLLHEGRGAPGRIKVLERVLAGVTEQGYRTVLPAAEDLLPL